jgi:alpha-ribazole phosphatase
VIYLLRHGVIDNPHRGFVGQSDLALNRQGIAQARRWVKVLGGTVLERIVTSDLSRTLATARIVAEGRSVETIPALREINLGRWEGLTKEQIQINYPDLWQSRWQDPANCRPPDGESFQDLSTRVVPAFEIIARQAQGNILMVAHAGVIRVILCHLLDIPLAHVFRIGQDYGALNLIDPQVPKVMGVNLRPEIVRGLL